jgi:Domain of unknown function (DUF927)
MPISLNPSSREAAMPHEEQAPLGNGSTALVTVECHTNQHNTDQSGDQTQRLNALFQWAEGVLEAAGLLKLLRDAKTREELDAIEFELDNLVLIMMIRDALHPGSGRSREEQFKHLTEKMLQGILRNRFVDYKKEQKKKLIANERQTAAEGEARERRDEEVKLYGELGQYKVRNRGVFFRAIEELETGEQLTKWVQISRTRIELMAVTRSNRDDNWGVYVKIVNMDGRVTCVAIPRNIINDKQGTIAGRLANLGADVVREQRKHLPEFLLTTVEVVNDTVQDLTRFMAMHGCSIWLTWGRSKSERRSISIRKNFGRAPRRRHSTQSPLRISVR